MAISLDEFKQKYNQPQTKPSGPISLDEFKQQYGGAVSDGSGVPQETREQRIEEGLPVSTKARFDRTGKAKPSVGGTLVRGAIKPAASLLATATSGFRAPEEGEGPIQARSMQSEYLGEVKPLQAGLARGVDKGVERVEETGRLSSGILPTLGGAGASTAAGVGTALEAGSYALGVQPLAGVAKQGVSALTKPALGQLAKGVAKTEALAGAIGSGGASMREQVEQGQPFGRAVGNVALNSALGGAVGAVAGPTLAVAGRGLGTVGRLLTAGGRAKVSEEAVEKSVSSLKDLFSTQSGQKYVDNVAVRKGDEPFRLIVESGALRRADIKDNKVVTTQGIKKLQEGQNEFENLLQESLDPTIEPRLVSVRDVAERVLKNIDESQYTAKTKEQLRKQTADDLRAIINEYGADTFNLQTWNDIKRTFWREAFPEGRAITDIDKLSRNRKYLTGRGIMEAIQDFAENPDIRELNDVIGTYAEAKKILNNLSKQTLRKGQLGRYVLQGIGTGVGSAAGGPLGGLAGALGGDIVTNILQKLSVQSPLRAGMIKYIRKYRPDLTNRLERFLKQRRVEVETAPRLNQGATITPQRDRSGVLPQQQARERLQELGVPPEGYRRNLPATIPGQTARRNTEPVQIPPRGAVPRGIGNEPQAKSVLKPDSTASIAKELGVSEDLIQEAKKYKSAEEFVKASKPIFHATDKSFNKFSNETGGTWFTTSEEAAKSGNIDGLRGRGRVIERYLGDLKLMPIEEARTLDDFVIEKRGFDGIIGKFSDGEQGDFIKLFDGNKARTKSQLTDIWKKANKKTLPKKKR